MLNHFGGSGVILCLSLARELGVLKMLQKAKQPLTSQQVADKLSLRERYVREILGSLCVGEVISVDDASSQFHVPEEHKQTFEAVSVFARLVPQFGMGYNSVKDCAQQQNPDGMVYSESPVMFDILKGILIIWHQSCGIWLRNRNKLASRFKDSKFLGSDVANEPLEEARADANSRGIQNVTYSTNNIETISEKYKDSFDWILTRDATHDLTYPQQALNQIYRCLKPGGIYSMIDVGLEGGIAGNIADASSMFYYSGSTFMCIPESFRQSDAAALGATWGAPLAREMVAKAGFVIINESASRTAEKEIHFVCQKQH